MNLVNRNTSALYTGKLRTELDEPVTAAMLTSLTLTLRDHDTGAIINGRNAQDVNNVNGVTIDALGNIEWTIAGADNPVISPAKDVELHEAVFEATWSGGGSATHVVEIYVRNV